MAAVQDWYDVTRARRTGTWLYGGSVPCKVYLIERDVWPGTGEADDPPAVAGDRDIRCVEVLLATPIGEPHVVSGGYHADADAAAEHLSTLLGPTLVWDGTNAER